MPEFELVSREEAMMTSSNPAKSEAIQEYVERIRSLGRDEAMRLTPSEGETVATVRRRLGAAVKATGKSIRIKRLGSDVYFWEDPPKRRGGRPRKNAAP